MTAKRLAVALVCLGLAPAPAASDTARKMTFDEALAAAGTTPLIARLAAEVDTAQAALVTAGTYPHNPELEVELAERRGPDASTTDREAGVSQRLEVAGQRSKRLETAEAGIQAARATFRQARIEVLGGVARAFSDAVYRREMLAIETTEAELARAFAAMVERRLDAGSATAVDLALARAGLARAERGLALATASYHAAQARLAERVGAAQSPLVAPEGDLPPVASPPPLDELLGRAMATRGDLAAAAARIEAAESGRRLARALGFPDVTVAARAGHEEGDDLAGIGIAVPIPLFDRNQGGIARADAEIVAARGEHEVVKLAARREVSAAHGRLVAALTARRTAERLGVTPLEEGLTLLERSFEAGKIGSAELLLYRRELVEGRRQALAATRDVWEAALDLAVATGGDLPGLNWTDEETDR